MAQALNIDAKQHPFVLVAPNIRSGHNVGAMFRTADGAGVDKIYLCGYSPRPPHPQIDKVSLGAEKTVPWEYAKQPGRLIKKLKAAGYCLVALEQTRKSGTIYAWTPRWPLALVVGNEVAGISPKIIKRCDRVVHLPMRGAKGSLNVSVATGIALYYSAQRRI